MYLIGIFCIILSLGCVITESELRQAAIRLAPKQSSKLLQQSLQCIRETGADAAILVQIRNKKYGDGEDEKKFFFCLFRKAGISSKKGLIKVDKLLEIYPDSADKVALRKTIEACNKETGQPMDNVFNFFKCFQKNTPVRIAIT